MGEAVVWEGVVTSVRPSGNGFVLNVDRWRTPEGRSFPSRRLAVVPSSIPARFRSIVPETPAPVLGSAADVRVTGYADGRLRVVAAEIRPAAPHADARDTYRLAYVQSYFDCTEQGEETLYSIASRVLARHPADPAFARGLWVRERIADVLFFYESAERARHTIARFGDPEHHGNVSALRQLLKSYRDQIALVNVVPFLPARASGNPTGWWGGFPTAIHSDDGRVLFRTGGTR